jgi:PelA/Pel-15E family pectate lyase
LESVGLVKFLMSVPPSAEVIRAVDGATAWYSAHALHGVVWDRNATTGTGLAPHEGAPELWARFYELETDKPIFGDRDRSVHYVVTELSSERRRGYGWYNSRACVLTGAYAEWSKKVHPRTGR